MLHCGIRLAKQAAGPIRPQEEQVMGPSLRIALISEHASPLAAAGGTDTAGPHILVDRVARGLAAAGHAVDVLTRRDRRDRPTVVDLCRGVRVLHLDAGPAEALPQEDLLPHMPAFAAAAGTLIKRAGDYDVQHANFFMSGWVGLALRRRFGTPLVITFHDLALGRQRHAGGADRFPEARVPIEQQLATGADAVIATNAQDAQDLLDLYGADPARLHVVPCGVDQAAALGRDSALRVRRHVPWDEVTARLVQVYAGVCLPEAAPLAAWRTAPPIGRRALGLQ
jgi:D-inositol-3-phosphate glycosyltransferase